METDIEAWRLVIDHWKAQGKDLRHLEVPPELASQLGVPMNMTKERRREPQIEEEESEDDMAKKVTKKKAPKRSAPKKAAPSKAKATSVEPVPVATSPTEAYFFDPVTGQPLAPIPAQNTDNEQAPEVGTGEYKNLGKKDPKWKKRSQFDGESCGLSGCAKSAQGYVAGIRSTKEGERDKRSLWFGPACHSCADKFSPGMKTTSLAELAHQRNGVSDLALVLDLEVGEVQKRLAAAGIDEKGRPLTISGSLTAEVPITHHTGGPFPGQPVKLQVQTFTPTSEGVGALPVTGAGVTEEVHLAIVIQTDVMGAIQQEMHSSLVALQSFSVRSQGEMDYSSNYMQRVKCLFKQLDETRKELGRPLREKLEHINTYFKPTLDLLEQVEGVIKQKVDEGYRWSQQQLSQGFNAAQAALASGNSQGVALATQQAMSADLSLSKGVTMTPKVKWEIVDHAQIHPSFWSPDPAKIDAYLSGLDKTQLQAQASMNNGYNVLAGFRVWFENTVSARAA